MQKPRQRVVHRGCPVVLPIVGKATTVVTMEKPALLRWDPAHTHELFPLPFRVSTRALLRVHFRLRERGPAACAPTLRAPCGMSWNGCAANEPATCKEHEDDTVELRPTTLGDLPQHIVLAILSLATPRVPTYNFGPVDASSDAADDVDVANLSSPELSDTDSDVQGEPAAYNDPEAVAVLMDPVPAAVF